MNLITKHEGKLYHSTSSEIARVHWEIFPEEFPEIAIENEPMMSNCCGGFTLDALMNVYVKKIEGDI